jgi:ABC-2 type transport system permease protein
MAKYLKTVFMTSQNLTNGGIAYLLMGYALRVVYVIPLLLLWRSLMAGGVVTGMSLGQMLTYTFLGTILAEILVVRTPASNWLYEGLIISLYQRPMGILSHLMAQTVGGWVPDMLLFTLPMVLASPLFGVSLVPLGGSTWFAVSLGLCVSLGFAVDFAFACLTIRLKNASWLVYSIRGAVVSLLSGSVIPFAILPFGLGKVLQYLPLGSLAGAPLSIYTGLTDPLPIIVAQVFWNLTLWPLTIIVFRKSQEWMVSHGG